MRDGKPPPRILSLAWMCEAYHCLPSQLMQEDASLLYQMGAARALASDLRKDSKKWSGETWRVIQLDAERQKAQDGD